MARKAQRRQQRSARLAARVSQPRKESLRIATTETAQRPSHIVVFKRPSEQNLAVVEKALNLKQVRGMSLRTSVTMLQARAAGAAHSRVYNRLGVAAIDMDVAEAESMQAKDEVAMVVPNEIRTVPEPAQPLPHSESQSLTIVVRLSLILPGCETRQISRSHLPRREVRKHRMSEGWGNACRSPALHGPQQMFGR